MILKRIRLTLCLAFLFALVCLNAPGSFAQSSQSQVVSRTIRSENIARNLIAADPARNMLVYLPAGYNESSPERYPVIYFLPNPFENGNLIEQARAANPHLEIIARAHSDAEVDHLKHFGASLIIMGEREIAKGMTQHILDSIDERLKNGRWLRQGRNGRTFHI